MKKRRLAAIVLAAPLTLLCACGGTPELSMSANWYRNTALGDNITGTNERLEYSVTFQPSEGDFQVSYSEGKYVTELVDDGTGRYILTSELSLTGKYTLNGQDILIDGQAEFNDSIKTRVVFKTVREGLRPVSSEKIVKNVFPLSALPDSAENAVQTYDYTYTVEYDDALSTAKTTYLDNSKSDAEPIKQDIRLGSGGSYLDNEELLFALRAVNLSSAAEIRVLDSANQAEAKVTVSPNAAVEFDAKNLTIDGAATPEKIPAQEVFLSYNRSFRGGAQTLQYAKTTDPNNNAYRNVLLRMEVPILYTLGTFTYQLTSATFAVK